MSRKKYLIVFWLRAKNVAMEYVESLDVIRKIKKLYKHDRCEVVELESFDDRDRDKPRPVVTKDADHQRGWATKVRCVETGEVWKSVADCHRKTGYGFFQLNSACTTGRDLNGRHYEYYRENDNTSVHPRLDADGEQNDQ